MDLILRESGTFWTSKHGRCQGYRVVLDDGRYPFETIIGAITESPDPPAPRWVWEIFGTPPPFNPRELRAGDSIDPPPGWKPDIPPISGRADSLEEAEAAWRAAWEALGPVDRTMRAALHIRGTGILPI
jgi:hypothetical protein